MLTYQPKARTPVFLPLPAPCLAASASRFALPAHCRHQGPGTALLH